MKGPAPIEDAPVVILTDEDLQHPPYNLTPHFIRNHAREMGNFSRPRRFIKAYVEAFLVARASRTIHKVLQTQAAQVSDEVNRQAVREMVDQILGTKAAVIDMEDYSEARKKRDLLDRRQRERAERRGRHG